MLFFPLLNLVPPKPLCDAACPGLSGRVMFEHGWPRGAHTITSPDAEPRLQAEHQLFLSSGGEG